MPSSIDITNLTFGYNTPLFDGKPVSLSVSANEIVALIGPSGIGKSTLLAATFNSELRLDGNIELRADEAENAIVRIGYVPQDASGESPLLSVLDIVSLGQVAIGPFATRKAQHDAMQILMELNLGHLSHRRIPELSGGQQQRVMLARAIMASRTTKILCLDEPTANLDEESQKIIYKLLKELAADGYAILMSTHDLDFALREASTVVAMSHNRVDVIAHSELESSGFLDSLFMEDM